MVSLHFTSRKCKSGEDCPAAQMMVVVCATVSQSAVLADLRKNSPGLLFFALGQIQDRRTGRQVAVFTSNGFDLLAMMAFSKRLGWETSVSKQ